MPIQVGKLYKSWNMMTGYDDTVTQICVEFLIPGRRFMH